MVTKAIARVIEQTYINKLESIGKIIVDKLGILLEATVGHPTKLSEAFEYKVENNELKIYATSDIITYIEKGTKPHIIRPKDPKGALAFRAGRSVTNSKGRKINMGDTVLAKEVHHPGTDARPFISAALFTSKPQIIKLLAKDGTSPTLTFVIEGDNLYLLR